MDYLIDTHVLLWYSEGQDRLSKDVLNILNNPESNINVSHATFWEMSIKKSLGKLDLIISVSDFYETVVENSFLPINFNVSNYQILENLPLYHQDPFDRMIIAQAITENFTIITQDRKFELYKELVSILWN